MKKPNKQSYYLIPLSSADLFTKSGVFTSSSFDFFIVPLTGEKMSEAAFTLSTVPTESIEQNKKNLKT